MIFVLLASVVFAGEIPLLALTEHSNGSSAGSVTVLGLDVADGSERVFLETFPLTRITTQVSVRFAQQVACHEFGFECGEKDFFFAIKALPGPIIGGPSAGAAAAVLVAGVLQNVSLNESVAVTGTINSGGLVGPVGGLELKVRAAGSAGLKTVLIPAGTRYQQVDGRKVDLVAVGESVGVVVKEVATLREAFAIFSNTEILVNNKSLSVDALYRNKMREIAQELCQRTALLRGIVENESGVLVNLSIHAADALANNASYSAASFCFRANVLARQLQNKGVNISEEIGVVEAQILFWEGDLAGHEIKSLADLQTFIAVHERLVEARERLDLTRTAKDNAEARRQLAFAQERVLSAKAWSSFFDGRAQGLTVSDDDLQRICASKISEAEERFSYVKDVLSKAVVNRVDIERAYAEHNRGEFVACIGTASKAKAEADVVVGLLGVDEDRLPEILGRKLEVVHDQLLRSQEKGVFPMIGYSYYEYAKSLAEVDAPSALLFSEYALELSDLGVYVKKKKGVAERVVGLAGSADWYTVIMSFLVGVLVTSGYYIVMFKRRRKRKA